MNAENKITKRKTYTITATYYADGTMKLGRLNDGFDALELLGVCHITEVDIKEQVAGNVKADIIERQVMKD